jgi:hypothetical protein
MGIRDVLTKETMEVLFIFLSPNPIHITPPHILGILGFSIEIIGPGPVNMMG